MTQVAKQEKTPPAITLLKSSLGEIARALPAEFSPDRFARIALTELRKNPALLNCDPYSFIGAVIQSAQLGLEVGSGLGHAYLVPYGKECTLIVGYKGDAELARRSGKIAAIDLVNVYKEDAYEYYVRNGEMTINHTPKPGRKADQDIIATYGVAHFTAGGRPQMAWMWREEIEEIRDRYSKGANRADSPWQKNFPEMCKKTVCRRLNKLLPKSPQYIHAEALEAGEVKAHQPLIDIGMIPDSYTIHDEPGPEKYVAETKAAVRESAPVAPGEKVAADKERQAAFENYLKLANEYQDLGGHIENMLPTGFTHDGIKDLDTARIKAAAMHVQNKIAKGDIK